MALNISHSFIAIEGNIGAGKTTLSRMLAEDLQARLILEAFADNSQVETSISTEFAVC